MNVVCPACHEGFDLDELKIADDTLLICPECMAEFAYGDRITGAEAEMIAAASSDAEQDVDPFAEHIATMEPSEDSGKEEEVQPTGLETAAWSIPDDFGADFEDPFAAAEAEEAAAKDEESSAATMMVSSPILPKSGDENDPFAGAEEDPFAGAVEGGSIDDGPSTVAVSLDDLKAASKGSDDGAPTIARTDDLSDEKMFTESEEEPQEDENPSINSIPGLEFNDLVFIDDEQQETETEKTSQAPATANYLPTDEDPFEIAVEDEPVEEEAAPLTMSSFEGNMMDDLTEEPSEGSSDSAFSMDSFEVEPEPSPEPESAPDPPMTQSILEADVVGFEDFLASRDENDGGNPSADESSDEIFDLLDLADEQEGSEESEESAFFVDSPSISALSLDEHGILSGDIQVDSDIEAFDSPSSIGDAGFLQPDLDPLAAATGAPTGSSGGGIASFLVGIMLGIVVSAAGVYGMIEFNLGPMIGVPQLAQQKSMQQVTKEIDQAKISPSLKAKDSPGAYADEINRLENIAKKLPDDGRLNERIGQVFARYQERFPIEFERDSKMQKKWASQQKLLKDPVNTLFLKAVLELGEGKTKESLETLQTHLALRTEDSTVAYLLAKIHLVDKNYEKAEELLRGIVEEDPNDTRASFFLSQALSRQSKFDAAEKFLDQIFKLNPDHLEGRLEFAQNLVQQGKYKQAQEQATQILELANQRQMLSAVYEGHIILSRVSASLNEPEKRAEHLTKALEIDTNEPVLLDLVNIYLDRENFTRAGETLRKCKDIKCGSEGFFTATVTFLVGTKQADKAEAWANKGLEKFKESTSLLIQKAEAAERRNQLRNARSVYEQIAELKPEEPEAYVRLARIFIKEKNFVEVEKVLGTGLSKVTNKAPLLNELVTVYELRQDPVQRKETLKKLVQLEPSNANYRVRLARAYTGLAMHEEALEQFTELLRLGRIGDQEMVEYVQTLLKLGKLEEAKEEAEKYYKIKPNNVAAALNLGEIYYQRKEYKEAEKYLMEAIAIEGSNPHAHFVLGVVFKATDKIKESITHLTKASNLTPDEENPEYRYKLAEVLIQTKDKKSIDEAVHHLTQLIKLVEAKKLKISTDRIAELYHMRGNIRFDRGGMPQAFQDFKKALALDTDKRSVLVDYGKALYMTRKLPESKRYLLEVVEKEPYHPVANLYLGKIALKGSNKKEAENRFKNAVKHGGKQYPSIYKDLGNLYYEKGLSDLAKSNFKKYLLYSERRPVDADEIEKIINKL